MVALETELNKDSDGAHGQFEVQLEELGDSGFSIRLRTLLHGVDTVRFLGSEFFQSSEYKNLVQLGQHIHGTLQEGTEVVRGDKTAPIGSLAQGIDWLIGEAKRGVQLQRYKGLGEMNPDQLWETTLDPEIRRLLQVRIEDAVAADELFTTLMGDQVEPRRDFIETNALSVANLDA